MFCKQCGREIADDCNLCGYCGTPVDNKAVPCAQKIPVTLAPKKKKNLLWLWIALGVAGLAAIGGLVWFLFFNKSDVTIWLQTKTTNIYGSTEYCYDENGYLTQCRYKHMDIERYTYNYTYEFNDEGNPVEVLCYSDGKLNSRHVYDYDEDGNLIQETDFDEDGQEQFRYVYDERGFLIEEVTLLDGKEQFHYTNNYDKNGNISETISDEDYRTVYDYDKDGKLIGAITYDPLGEERSRQSYDYDENGNLIKKSIYWGDDERYRTVYKYDENGNQIESVHYEDDTETERETYEWQEITVSWEQAETLYALYNRTGRYRFPDEFAAEMKQK